MRREQYIYPGQDMAFDRFREGVAFQKDAEDYYEENDYKLRLPDLYGKTVRVGQKQFPTVHTLMQQICRAEGLEPIPVYVYEEFYYGAESYGIRTNWIEISAKTIQDFTKEELMFVLAREVYKIKDGVTRQRVMMEQRYKAIRTVGTKEMEDISKLGFNGWYRMANYTADNFGYATCKNLEAAKNAILKMVLNSVNLAEQVNLSEFMEQASMINALDDTVFNYTKADETMPYAPHRIQNLFAYAGSMRGMDAAGI